MVAGRKNVYLLLNPNSGAPDFVWDHPQPQAVKVALNPADLCRAEYPSFCLCSLPPPLHVSLRQGCNCCEAEKLKIRTKQSPPPPFSLCYCMLSCKVLGKKREGGGLTCNYAICVPLSIHPSIHPPLLPIFLLNTHYTESETGELRGDGMFEAWKEMTWMRLHCTRACKGKIKRAEGTERAWNAIINTYQTQTERYMVLMLENQPSSQRRRAPEPQIHTNR